MLLVLGLLAGGAALRDRPDRAAPHATPAPVASAAAVAADAAPVLPVGVDLTTAVSVGHVRSTAVDGERARDAGGAGAARGIPSAPTSCSPRNRARRPAAPKGVEVLFDRQLDDRAVDAFVTAVEALPASTAFVTEEPGTTVAVSAPLLPGSGCEPAATDPSGAAERSFAGWFPLFALTSTQGRVVLSYTGPARTPEQLGQTASFLARLCGVPVGDVRLTRAEHPAG